MLLTKVVSNDENNKAPKVFLRRTNKKALKVIDLEIIKKLSIDLV